MACKINHIDPQVVGSLERPLTELGDLLGVDRLEITDDEQKRFQGAQDVLFIVWERTDGA